MEEDFSWETSSSSSSSSATPETERPLLFEVCCDGAAPLEHADRDVDAVLRTIAEHEARLALDIWEGAATSPRLPAVRVDGHHEVQFLSDGSVTATAPSFAASVVAIVRPTPMTPEYLAFGVLWRRCLDHDKQMGLTLHCAQRQDTQPNEHIKVHCRGILHVLRVSIMGQALTMPGCKTLVTPVRDPSCACFQEGSRAGRQHSPRSGAVTESVVGMRCWHRAARHRGDVRSWAHVAPVR